MAHEVAKLGRGWWKREGSSIELHLLLCGFSIRIVYLVHLNLPLFGRDSFYTELTTGLVLSLFF